LKVINDLCSFHTPGNRAVLVGSVGTAASFGPEADNHNWGRTLGCDLIFCFYPTIS
jgi:hypothetical protein